MTPNLTSKGHVLLLRALDGEALKFTRIQLGNGAAQNAKSATALSNPLVTLPLTKMVTGSPYITLTSSFSNNAVSYTHLDVYKRQLSDSPPDRRRRPHAGSPC